MGHLLVLVFILMISKCLSDAGVFHKASFKPRQGKSLAFFFLGCPIHFLTTNYFFNLTPSALLKYKSLPQISQRQICTV